MKQREFVNKNKAYYKRELSQRKKNVKGFTKIFDLLSDLLGNPLNWNELICSLNNSIDMRRLLLKPNLKHKERFILTLFLLTNGIDPLIIKEYYITNNSLRDDSARKSVYCLIDRYDSDENFMNNFYSFSLVENNYMYLNNKKKKR